MKAKLKGQESSDDEYADDDFEMPAGFDFEGPRRGRGRPNPKTPGLWPARDHGGRGRGGSEVRGDDGFHPDENVRRRRIRRRRCDR